MPQKVGALWTCKKEDGKKFLGGVIDLGLLGDIRVVIFSNEKKGEDDKQPDYIMLVAENQEAEGGNGSKCEDSEFF